MNREYIQKGTLLGKPVFFSNNVDRLGDLHIVTNKGGKDARIHLVWSKNVYRASKHGIKALCNNPLKNVGSSIHPFVAEAGITNYFTHSDTEIPWCTTCETEMRNKCFDGQRFHDIVVMRKGDHVLLLGVTPA